MPGDGLGRPFAFFTMGMATGDDQIVDERARSWFPGHVSPRASLRSKHLENTKPAHFGIQ